MNDYVIICLTVYYIGLKGDDLDFESRVTPINSESDIDYVLQD